MKLFTKVCLMISLIFLCIGAVCLGIGAALGSGLGEVWAMAGNGELDVGNLHFGRWNVPYIITDDISDSDEELKIEKGVVDEKFSPQEVENLEINIKYGAVYVTDSQTDQIEICVDAPERNSYQCGLKGKTLQLIDNTPRYRWNALRNNNKIEITIAIPKGTVFDEVDLAADAGGVEISHELTAQEIHFDLDAGELVAGKVTAADEFSADVDAGNLEIEEFAAKSLEVDCGVGSATLSGSVLEEAKADCGVGRIVLQLTGREDDFDYDVNCSLGTVSINGITYTGLSKDKEIHHHTGREVRLDCGVGEIEVTVEEEE